MKLHDAIVEKIFCSLFDMSEIFSDHYFRKIFNFRFYGELSDFDFCSIFENWRKSLGVWGFHHQAICIYFVYAKSMLATSCGGQLLPRFVSFPKRSFYPFQTEVTMKECKKKKTERTAFS